MPDSVDRPGGTQVTPLTTVSAGPFATKAGTKRLPVEQVVSVVAVSSRKPQKTTNLQVEAGMNKPVRRFYLK